MDEEAREHGEPLATTERVDRFLGLWLRASVLGGTVVVLALGGRWVGLLTPVLLAGLWFVVARSSRWWRRAAVLLAALVSFDALGSTLTAALGLDPLLAALLALAPAVGVALFVHAYAPRVSGRRAVGQ